MLIVIMLIVVMLIVVMLIVKAPFFIFLKTGGKKLTQLEMTFTV
jgi:hypothetical protein